MRRTKIKRWLTKNLCDTAGNFIGLFGSFIILSSGCTAFIIRINQIFCFVKRKLAFYILFSGFVQIRRRLKPINLLQTNGGRPGKSFVFFACICMADIFFKIYFVWILFHFYPLYITRIRKI